MANDRRMCSPGWGDGEDAVVAQDICAVEVSYNGTHPHLPGDFVRRKKDGSHILVKKDKFDNLQEATRGLYSYWVDCKPQQHGLDDCQISEITKRMESLRRMLGVKE